MDRLDIFLVAETFLSESEQSSISIIAFSLVGLMVGVVCWYRDAATRRGLSHTGFGQ